MPTVWWMGRGSSNTIRPEDWAAHDIVAGSVVWDASNGWSVDEATLTSDQIAILEADSEFRTGQTGPRAFPAPGAIPIETDYRASAYAYYLAIKALYDLWLGGDLSSEAILAISSAVTAYLNENPVATMQVDGLTDAGTPGKNALKASTQADARAAFGAVGVEETASLNVAVKRGDPWWNSVMAEPSDIPTITVATSSQIISGTTLTPTADYDYDPYFRYDGCHAVLVDSGGAYAAGFEYGEVVVPEIVTDAQDIEAVFTSGRTGAGVLGFRCIIDGKMTSISMTRVDSTSGSNYYFKHHFAAAKVRHLKFEVDGANRFKSVIVSANTVLQRPKGPHNFRMATIADSLGQGGPSYHIGAEVSGDFFYFRFESHGYYQSRLLGCDSFIALANGGTGHSDNVPDNPYSARIPTALLCYPHVLGIFGSRNDSGKESQVLPAVMATLDRVQDIPLVLVCGPQQAGYATLNELVRQGTVAAGRTWLNLDGVAASPASNPTGHPTLLEQLKLAKAAHAQIDMSRIVSRVEARNASLVPVSVVVTPSVASPAHTGTSITFTATVSSAVTSVGKIQFYDGSTPLGSAITVSGGTATYTTSALSTASHSLMARFLPANPQSTKFAASIPITFVVDANLGVSESFNRADSASLGNSDNGKPWSVTGTHWAISGNKLINTSPGAGEWAYIDPGTIVGNYDWTLTGTPSIAVRLVMLFSDTNNYAFINANGGSNNWKMWSRISGVSTAVVGALGATSPNWVAGDIMRCIVSQGSTSSKFNFILRKSSDAGATWSADIFNVSDIDMTPLAANRKAGMYLDSVAPSVTLDAFVMTAA